MAANENPPNPFPDPNAPDLAIEVAQVVPGAQVNGPIESLKRSIMVALRDALTGTSLTLSSASIKVSMEYPMSRAMNPGIWVQFSFPDLNRAGIDHEVIGVIDGVQCPIQEWIFYGRVSLTIIAYTALECDRLADAFVNNIAFARTPDLVLTKPDEDTKQFRSFIAAINANPYVFLTVNTDSLSVGGPGMSVGTPWDENQFVYEHNFTFDTVGQFNVAFRHDGSYTLTDFDINPTQLEEPEAGWSRWI